MRTISRQRTYNAPASEVFEMLDNLGVTGTHMTNPSMMMMGSKLSLNYLSPQHAGLNSRYRWQGKMMGIPMDFTVLVTRWDEGRKKVWETIGNAKLIIYSWYRMMLTVSETNKGTLAELSITYKRPTGFFKKILSYLFANLYCVWCLNTMLRDARHAIDSRSQKTFSSTHG